MAVSAAPAKTHVPLCVDLDGTLLKGDTLFEHLVALARTRPHIFMLLPFWLLRGRAYFKHRICENVSVAPDKLPFRSEVVDYLRSEHQQGRPIVLVTAAPQVVADSIAKHLGVFAHAYGSASQMNLKGRTKADKLVALYGEKGFEYMGDSSADLEVWKHASAAHVVGTDSMVQRASQLTTLGRHFATQRPSLRSFIRSIRLHHWSKNFLIFLPLVLAHRLDAAGLKTSIQAFFSFGLCASGLYVFNDLLDLHSDRCHPSKKARPFASGELPLWLGGVGSIALIAATFALSMMMDRRFAVILAFYAALTILYSWKIKKIVLADVFVLASFYGIRIVAGSEATNTPLSHWFLVFSGFFFLSLAMAKRSSELIHAGESVRSGNSGRGYRVEDRDLVAVLGVASSFCCVVILALYAHSPEVHVLYRRPGLLLLICPVVLFWLSRIWLLAHRGDLDDDPVTFALRDGTSRVMGVVCLAILLLANLPF